MRKLSQRNQITYPHAHSHSAQLAFELRLPGSLACLNEGLSFRPCRGQWRSLKLLPRPLATASLCFSNWYNRMFMPHSQNLYWFRGVICYVEDILGFFITNSLLTWKSDFLIPFHSSKYSFDNILLIETVWISSDVPTFEKSHYQFSLTLCQ